MVFDGAGNVAVSGRTAPLLFGLSARGTECDGGGCYAPASGKGVLMQVYKGQVILVADGPMDLLDMMANLVIGWSGSVHLGAPVSGDPDCHDGKFVCFADVEHQVESSLDLTPGTGLLAE